MNLLSPQYNVTFDQTGVGSDFTGTVITIDGTNYTASDLPALFLWYNGSTHTFAFESPLVVGLGAKEYDWMSTTGLSSSQSGSITVTGSRSVSGNYMTRVHDVAVTNVVANCTWVYQGRLANINVTVNNNEDFPENPVITLYYNITASQIIGTQNVALLVGESKTLSFVWNT